MLAFEESFSKSFNLIKRLGYQTLLKFVGCVIFKITSN